MEKPGVEVLFAGDSEIAALMRSNFGCATENPNEFKTLLGSVETWSSSLKNAFSILLNSCCPMFLVWDCNPSQNSPEKRILFYNDEYLSLLKETQQLIPFGRSVKESWTDNWSQIRSDIEQVFSTGQALRREKEPFFNFPINHPQNSNWNEHVYTWSYSAIWDETDQVRGVFATGYRVTAKEAIAAVTAEEHFQNVKFQNVQEIQNAKIQNVQEIQNHQHTQNIQNLEKIQNVQTSKQTVQPQMVGLQPAEAALQESEARFQAFMRYSPTSAWITDRTGRILYLSPTYFQMFRFPQQNAVGKQIHDIYPEEFAQQFVENNHLVFETGQVIETIETAPRPDGSIGSFLAYKFPIIQASGELLLGGIAVDITERQRTEKTLQRREEALRLITNALPVLIAYVDKHHYYRFNNQTYESWFGRPATTVMGKHVREVLGEAAYEAVLPYMEQALSGQRVSYESQIPYREGGIRDIRADYVPHINSQGEVEGYFSLVTDITEQQTALREREQLLQELTAERARFEAVLRQMPEGVIIADVASGEMILSNERTNQILQHSFEPNCELEEYDQKTPFHAYHPDGRMYKPDDYPLVRSLRTGEVVNHEEMEIRYLDGHRIFINANSSPIFDSQGNITSAVVMIQEITARKEAETEREQILAREQAARKEAEQANRIKDEFLAVLSHELRSPLNPILGWAKLLQTRQFDAVSAKRALETIERNAKLQTQLIDDLLDVSRILRGKMMLNVSPISLITVVDAALETVRLSAEAKGIEIQKVIAGEIGLISGDAARLQQIVWNLLTNAVKFTPSGGTVEVRLEQIHSHIQIQVKDTGKGISPAFLPHVFEYFRQEDGTTTRKFGGLGLGLAIVRYLTEQHGGTVQAESPGDGLGAIFTVLLPASNTEGRRPLDAAEPSTAAAKSLLAEQRILVVDDEPDMRELIFTILQQAGAQVEVATSAIEVLETLDTFQPDVLISDIGMPEMDGYQLLHQIRSRSPEQGGSIPAIALTAYAGEMNQQQAITAGFQKHVAKPVEPEDLVKAIVALVNAEVEL
jgi:PAS domain S-box-containing protein